MGICIHTTENEITKFNAYVLHLMEMLVEHIISLIKTEHALDKLLLRK